MYNTPTAAVKYATNPIVPGSDKVQVMPPPPTAAKDKNLLLYVGIGILVLYLLTKKK